MPRHTQAFAAALGLTMLAVPLGARTAPATDPPQLFRATVSLVSLNVTVQDAKSNYVPDLQPGDFAVYEDGVRQDVRFFEAASLPIDLIVMLDTSRSMSDKMALARSAARGFLATLRPGDRGAVVGFNHAVNVLKPLTCERRELDEAIDGTVAGGSTALHTALYIALREFGIKLGAATAVRRQAIAVLSDGEDTASAIPFDDVLALARQTGVNVYTVRLQTNDLVRDTDPLLRRLMAESDYEMKTLARETGALSFFPQPEQLRGVYSSIAKELASQYAIGYQPIRGSDDGRFRRVQVQVVTHPELRARTRTGYTAGGAFASTSASR